MSDRFYRTIRFAGHCGLLCTSRATVLHAERTTREGAWLLAANHVSPYDTAPIIRSCRRIIDWVSITEVFEIPPLRWLCSRMGAFPINRAILDTQGLRVIYERLAAGRVVGIFPEGELVKDRDLACLTGADFRSGVGKIAYAADVPVVPCVHVDMGNFGPLHRWLPLRLIRYGIIFGEPLSIDRGLPRREAARKLEEDLAAAMRELHRELLAVYQPANSTPDPVG